MNLKNKNPELSSDRVLWLLSLIIPILFLFTGLICILTINESLNIDGYLFISTSRGLLEGYGYRGHFGAIYPPLYTVIVSLLGTHLNLITATKLVSLFSATGLLISLPFISKQVTGNYIPGLWVQMLLATNPSFFRDSMQSEAHTLDAFLFVVAVYFGFSYLNQNKRGIPYAFSSSALLAALTRYTSLIIPFAFAIGIVNRKLEKRSWLKAGSVVGGFFLLYSPWLLYNFLKNGYFFSNERWNVIGFSLTFNKIWTVSPLDWFFLKFFQYSSLLDFVIQHPYDVGLNHLINFYKILNLYLYNFSPLGVFSAVVGIGFIVVLLRSLKDSSYIFILILLLGYALIASIATVRWVYFIHLCPILAVIGFSYIRQLLKKNIQYLTTFNLTTFVIGSLILLGFFYQFEGMISSYKYQLETNFRIPKDHTPRIKKYIEEELAKFKKNILSSKKSGRKIMTLFSHGQVYRANFIPITMPLPDSSILESLCYENMSKRRLRFVRSLNIPPGLERKQYIPADYALIGHSFRSIIKRRNTINYENYHQYLKPVHEWNKRYGFQLYEIRKEFLPCVKLE